MEEVTKEKVEEHKARNILPKGKLHWLSVVMLIVLLVGYLGGWINGNWAGLFDPMTQNDDVRQHVMPMHRYDGEGTLKDDPVALNMLAMSTIGMRLLYMLITPVVGIYIGSKVIQTIAFLILFAGLVLIARSKRAGLACAALLCFFIFHTEAMISSIGSGLQRGFAFPFIVMWLAGAFSEKRTIRYISILLLSGTYPSAMLLLLAVEAVLMLHEGIHLKSPCFWKKIRNYSFLLVACFLVLQVDSLTKPRRGGPPTEREALHDPAFGKHGRTKQVPIKDPGKRTVAYLTDVFGASPQNEFRYVRTWRFKKSSGDYRRMGTTFPLAIIALLIFLSFAKVAPKPTEAVAFFCGTMFLYLLARGFAFRLYIPHRYLFYGLSTCSLLLVASVIGRVGYKMEQQKRASIRNFSAVFVILLSIFLMGDHLTTNVWARINRNSMGGLCTYIEALPCTIRIAVHPKDGDGISYWTGRAATPGNEQLVCWLDGAWKENKLLEEQTLSALYATERDVVLSFCKAQGITHFLINKKRYAKSIISRSSTFEPLTSYAAELLKGVKPEELVFACPPEVSILYRHGNLLLMDVKKLEQAWADEK